MVNTNAVHNFIGEFKLLGNTYSAKEAVELFKTHHAKTVDDLRHSLAEVEQDKWHEFLMSGTPDAQALCEELQIGVLSSPEIAANFPKARLLLTYAAQNKGKIKATLETVKYLKLMYEVLELLLA